MSPILRNCLLVGAAMGLWVIWKSWPDGLPIGEAGDARWARAAGQMSGALALWALIGSVWSRREKKQVRRPGLGPRVSRTRPQTPQREALQNQIDDFFRGEKPRDD